MVEIQAPSSSRARSSRPSSRRRARMRPRSSPAARSVYVITSSESTGRPRSQTARAKRSTSTIVFPVPAPDETSCVLDGPVDLAPELVFVLVVVPRETRNSVFLSRGPQDPARLALAGEGAIDAPDRLDSDEV